MAEPGQDLLEGRLRIGLDEVAKDMGARSRPLVATRNLDARDERNAVLSKDCPVGLVAHGGVVVGQRGGAEAGGHDFPRQIPRGIGAVRAD